VGGRIALGLLCAEPFHQLLPGRGWHIEKAKPTERELQCGLGQVFYGWQEAQFANHRKFNKSFFAHREAMAKELGIPLAGTRVDITFLDEFHGDKDGTRRVAEAVADKVEEILANSKAGEPATAPADA